MRKMFVFVIAALISFPVVGAGQESRFGFKGIYPGDTLSQCQVHAQALGASFGALEKNTQRNDSGHVISYQYLFAPMTKVLTLAQSKVDHGYARFVPSATEPRLAYLALLVDHDRLNKVKNALIERFGAPTLKRDGRTIWKRGNTSLTYLRTVNDDVQHSTVIYSDDTLLERKNKSEAARDL